MESLRFEGKVAVVTGGGGILCSALAMELAKNGARVAVLDLDEARGSAVAQRIQDAGYPCVFVQADVLNEDSLMRAGETVHRTFGKCDILLNGAGGNNKRATCDEDFFSRASMENPQKKSFFDLDLAGFRFVFDLNYMGTLLPTRVFVRDMLDEPGGAILNIASINANLPLTRIPAYSSAKAGVVSLTQWLATYFANCGIRVNAISYGFFSTIQNKDLLWNPDGTLSERSKKVIAGTPMGRFGSVDEAVGPAMWLLDNKAAGFVTGTVVQVDGGFTAYPGV